MLHSKNCFFRKTECAMRLHNTTGKIAVIGCAMTIQLSSKNEKKRKVFRHHRKKAQHLLYTKKQLCEDGGGGASKTKK